MLANYHTHTRRCRHAEGSDREFIEAAVSHGMRVLGFSDHCPWIFDDGYVSGTRMLPSDLDGYFTSLTDLKKEYAGDITIYIGFEAEYIPELMEKQNRLLADYPVDYMIMGQHFTRPEPDAPYTGSVTSSEAELAEYVELVIRGLETGKYKYVAHPDLLNYVGDDEIYARHYSRLCQYLASQDIPVEINLLGVKEGRHYTSEKFLKIAGETGNTAIIGCDAHYPSFLTDTASMEKCRRLAEKYSLRIVDYLPGLGEK